MPKSVDDTVDRSAFLGAYWDRRAQEPSDGAQRIAAMLDGLESLDPVFTNWHLKGWSQRDALRDAVERTPKGIESVLRGNRSEAPPHDPIESLGYYFDVWNAGVGGMELALSCHFGATAARISNVVTLRSPYRFCDDSAAAVALLQLVVRIWSPTWATVTDPEFRKATGIPVGQPQPGRATYLVSSRRWWRRPAGLTVIRQGTGTVFVQEGPLDPALSRAIASKWRRPTPL